MTQPLTESERAALPLAPGSRWEGYRVREPDTTLVHIGTPLTSAPMLMIALEDMCLTCDAANALAAIRAAGLDPEHAELVRLREAARRVFDTEPWPMEETNCSLRETRRVALEALRKLVKP